MFIIVSISLRKKRHWSDFERSIGCFSNWHKHLQGSGMDRPVGDHRQPMVTQLTSGYNQGVSFSISQNTTLPPLKQQILINNPLAAHLLCYPLLAGCSSLWFLANQCRIDYFHQANKGNHKWNCSIAIDIYFLATGNNGNLIMCFNKAKRPTNSVALTEMETHQQIHALTPKTAT